MPDMDGLELCRRLRAPSRRVYTYAILLTMRSGKSSYLEGLAAGADDFMSKPVDADELAARLKVGERIVGLQKEMRQAGRPPLDVHALQEDPRRGRVGARRSLCLHADRELLHTRVLPGVPEDPAGGVNAAPGRANQRT